MACATCALALLIAPATVLAKNDLTVVSVSGPTRATSGDMIQIATTVAWGTSSAQPRLVRIACYLSTDATITTGDVLLRCATCT